MQILAIVNSLFRRALKRYYIILLYVILPVLTLGIPIFLYSSNALESNIRIGVVDEDNSVASKYLIDDLKNRYGYKVDVIQNEISEQVVAENEVCAVIKIPDKFEMRIMNKQNTSISVLYLRQSESLEWIKEIINNYINNIRMLAGASNYKVDNFNRLLADFHESNIDLDIKRFDGMSNANVGYSTLGVMMFFMTVMATSSLSVIIEDINSGVFYRIVSSSTSYTEYILGHIIWAVLLNIIQIFLLVNLISIFNIRLGIDIRSYVLILSLVTVLSISLGVFCVSFCKKTEHISIVNMAIIMPSCIFSGCLLPIELMNKSFEKISFMFPQRYVLLVAENLIKGKSGYMLFLYIISLLLISIVLALVGIKNIGNRSVRV